MMKTLFHTILFVSILTILAIGVFPVAAQINNVNGGDFGIVNGTSQADLVDYIGKVIDLFLGVIGIVAVIFVIYAGVQLLTSAGDEKKAETAKHTVIYAIIGLVIIGLAAALINGVISGIEGAGNAGGGAGVNGGAPANFPGGGFPGNGF